MFPARACMAGSAMGMHLGVGCERSSSACLGCPPGSRVRIAYGPPLRRLLSLRVWGFQVSGGRSFSRVGCSRVGWPERMANFTALCLKRWARALSPAHAGWPQGGGSAAGGRPACARGGLVFYGRRVSCVECAVLPGHGSTWWCGWCCGVC